MAEQAPRSETAPEEVVLDAAEEAKQIKDVVEHDEMKVGDKYFLVAAHWYSTWNDYTACSADLVSSDVLPSRPGPIDNDILLEDDGSLRAELVEKNDYELLPERAWNLLYSWYGGRPVERRVIANGLQQTPQVELYPITVKVLYGADITEITLSRLGTFSDIRHQVASKHSIPPHKYALFVIEQDEDEPEPTASEITSNLLGQTLEEFQVESGQRGKVFEMRAASASLMLTQGPATSSASGASSSSYSGGYWSSRSSNAEGTPLYRGASGLANLGNTCFMNSALQCLSNTVDLTAFFTSDEFAGDVNEKNPIGMGGLLARAYAAMVKEIWSGKYTSVAPVEFKKVLGQFAPQFSGYQQQDSQELLSFLLDGLHEDLNRILDKPIVEAIESDGRPDAVVAEESWKRYLMRNDSKIVEIFQGQLKSTLVCPDCGRCSITFDPLMYLSLPIPTTTERVMQTLYWPPKAVHAGELERHGFVVPKMSSMRDFRDIVGKKLGVAAAQVVCADVYSGRPFLQADTKIIQDCRSTGVMMIYVVDEVPLENRMLVPVVQRKPSDYSKISKSLFSYPLLVAIEKGKTTNAELHGRVTERVKALLGEECPSFELTMCKEYGTSCGLCPVSKSCRGCPLPCDDKEVTSSIKFAVGVDWDEAVCKELMEAQKSWKFTEDESCSSTLEKDKDTISLEECLSLFTRQEVLGKDDTWYCNVCKDFIQATKKFDLWKLPEVLVIHLKRFQYSRYFRDKISTDVVYPLEGLSLAEHTLGPDKDAKYDLFAVSNHFGGIGGGHYTAYAFNLEAGKWLEFNDRRVSEIDASQVRGSQSYLLFYRKRKEAEGPAAPVDE